MQCHITCYHRQSKPCLFCTLGRLSGEEEWWGRQKEVEEELGGRGEEKRAEGAAAEGEEEREGLGGVLREEEETESVLGVLCGEGVCGVSVLCDGGVCGGGAVCEMCVVGGSSGGAGPSRAISTRTDTTT